MQNIVLIVLDTVSAFHTSLHSDQDTTPFLEQLADENTHCMYGYANGAWTVSAHASMFSGMRQEEHGTGTADLTFTAPSFVEDLQKDGYTTIGITNNLNIAPETGFARGFDQFYYGTETIEVLSRDARLPALERYVERCRDEEYSSISDKMKDLLWTSIKERDPRSLTLFLQKVPERILDGELISFASDSGATSTNRLALKTATETPFFLFLNYMEAHKELAPPEEYVDGVDYEQAREDYQEYINQHSPESGYPDIPPEVDEEIEALYDGAIQYLDEKIQELVNDIRQEHPETVFIIVGDHGDNINDYGVYDHQYSTYEKLLRVPFIITGPEIDDQTIEKPVSLADIPELIANDFDFEKLDGRVEAGYQGIHHLSRKEKDEVDSSFRALFSNTSKTVITAEEGKTDNSHLPNHRFIPAPDSFTADPQTEEPIDLRSGELDGIDI